MVESQNIEWKEAWRDEYLKWICGFANAQGGKIYIGINDSGKVIGIKNGKKLLEEIPNKIQTNLGFLANVNLLSENDLEYIEIVVRFRFGLKRMLCILAMNAYDLIMKNKELLLDRNPDKSPVRFIFSHSALREGWDNPNVFQICTLKQSSSEVRKRQEVGRGLRLCVNQDGERMDANVLGKDVHNVNVLTVIASESYDSFAKGLQSEIAESITDRPRAVTAELFMDKVVTDSDGGELIIDRDMAYAIQYDLIVNQYIDKKGNLTDKYYEDKKNGSIRVAEEAADFTADVIKIIDSVYDSRVILPENARSSNVELTVEEEKLAKPEFQALWAKINAKSVYVVDFDTEELVQKAIAALDSKLRVSKIYFKVETGVMERILLRKQKVPCHLCRCV